jgi:hypothetical protein
MEITPKHIRAIIEKSNDKKTTAKKLAQGVRDSGLSGDALNNVLFMIEYFANPEFKVSFRKTVFNLLKN